MNLSDLTTYVTTKSQLVEADDVAACQLFLSKRYELIYNSYLWKDAMGMVNVPVDPVNNLDNAAGVVMLPQQIDRLVAVRTNDASLRIQGLEHFYRIDWDAFCPTGVSTFGFCPREMAILNPVWFTVRPGKAQGISPTPTIYQDHVSQQYSYLVYNLTPGSTYQVSLNAPASSVQVGTFVNNQGTGYLNNATNLGVGPPGLWAIVTATTANNCIVVHTMNGAASVLLVSFTPNGPFQSIGPGSSIIITSDSVGDFNTNPPTQVKVTWRDLTDRYVTTAVLPITLTSADNSGYFEIESIFKPVTQGNLKVTIRNPYGGTFFDIVAATLPPTCTRSPSFQRLRIFPIPANATTLNVLGKKPFVPLNFPQEVPAIRNLDNCLIAYAMGDMLERSRQFGKANAQYQEAGGLLKELALLETIQAASNTHFIPENGYGDQFFGPGTQGYYAGEY